jgi:ubiquitin C-terminal hydrolase
MLNIGNSCYLNSVLVMLINNDKFIDRIKQYEESPLLNLIIDLSQKYKNNEACSPIGIKYLLEKIDPFFQGQEQQDAHECFLIIIDAIHKEIIKENGRNRKRSKNDSDCGIIIEGRLSKSEYKRAEQVWLDNKKKFGHSCIDDLFSGQIISCVYCHNCHNTLNNFELFKTIELIMPFDDTTTSQTASSAPSTKCAKPCTVIDCFQEFFKIEKIQYTCEKCRALLTKECSKKTILWVFPNNLVLVFKQYNNRKFKIKYEKFISFNYENEKVKYKLTCIINHIGSQDYGHYNNLIIKDTVELVDDDKRIKIDEVNEYLSSVYMMNYELCE